MNKHAPSQSVIDESGSKWRIAAAWAVLNSKNELLIGERIHLPGSWQAPQGGVDDAGEENNFCAETIIDAASRELYEEMGLQTNQDVLIMQNQDTPIKPVRCTANGTNDWLTKSGYTGQELHWVMFRCVNGRGDSDAALMCNLEGENGEAPEFSNVQWRPTTWVLENIWAAKRGPYEALLGSISTVANEWENQCDTIDFTGTWARDSSLNENVMEALIERGVPAEKAASEACGPYIQQFSRKTLKTWNIKTFGEGRKVRRDLDYPIGKSWHEPFSGTALLFGNVKDGLDRTTSYIAEPDADSLVSFVTITSLPGRGYEESRRYLRNGQLQLRRTFWPANNDSHAITCKEIFNRVHGIT